MDKEKVLFEEDLKKINEACVKYPLGSYQIGEIARLSGFIYLEGIDVINVLKDICDKRKINLE